jgi:hypothetical protein
LRGHFRMRRVVPRGRTDWGFCTRRRGARRRLDRGERETPRRLWSIGHRAMRCAGPPPGAAIPDRPLFDVQTKLRIVEWQLVQAAKQPAKRHPVISGKVAPEDRVLVSVGELPERIADFEALHRLAVELRAHVLQRPQVCLRPVHLVALGIELAPVFGDETDADEIDRVRYRDELGVDPIFHALKLFGATLAARMGYSSSDGAKRNPGQRLSCQRFRFDLSLSSEISAISFVQKPSVKYDVALDTSIKIGI